MHRSEFHVVCASLILTGCVIYFPGHWSFYTDTSESLEQQKAEFEEQKIKFRKDATECVLSHEPMQHNNYELGAHYDAKELSNMTDNQLNKLTDQLGYTDIPFNNCMSGNGHQYSP